jgi:hypothetical protein
MMKIMKMKRMKINKEEDDNKDDDELFQGLD